MEADSHLGDVALTQTKPATNIVIITVTTTTVTIYDCYYYTASITVAILYSSDFK